MISSALGAVIISMATVSLIVAVTFSEKILRESVTYELTFDEKSLIKRAGFTKIEDIENVEESIYQNYLRFVKENEN
tara:strand:+ start:15492 stop:15722 length:231 start_codon:yes stop_codon:yes gene_type:complete